MFLTEKTWSAEHAEPDQRGRGREIAGRGVGQLTIFVLSWLVTYNRAYLTGDDVNTFKGTGYGATLFLPRLKPDWIPNRVVDMYGRNLLVHVFDTIYFPAKSMFGADFFFVFKLFNATLFAVFLCLVYRYMADLVFFRERSLREGQKRDGGILPNLLIAFVILMILPWTNEVGMVCYQFPAFLSFVVLAELFKLMPRFSLPEPPGVPAAWLVTLAFIAAFSLEAYSAILAAAILFAGMLNAPWRLREVWRGPAFIVSCLLAVFSAAALVIAARLAQRPDAIEKASPIKQIEEFFLRNQLLSHDARLYCGLLVVGVVVPLLVLACLPLYHRLARGNGSAAGLIAPVWQNFSSARWVIFFLIVLFPTMIVTSLISLETSTNYFSLHTYPWGGFLLIAAFFAVPAITMPVISAWEGSFLADTARIFLMMLFISGAAIHAMRDSMQDYENSVRIQNAYRAAQENMTGVFDTGLSLDALALQMRPLPTAQSPSRFISGYPQFFKKYYGADSKLLFQ